MAIRVSFDTAPFVSSHAREPRGRGSWAFSFEGREPIFSPSMPLAEAKRWAAEQVRAAAPAGFSGTVVVAVLP
jgi:hypothetical protein